MAPRHTAHLPPFSYAGATVLSPLSDRIGRSLGLLVGSVVYGVGLLLASLLKDDGIPGPSPVFHISGCSCSIYAYAAALMFGLGDSAFNTQSYSILAQFYEGKDLVHSMTVLQLYQNLGWGGLLIRRLSPLSPFSLLFSPLLIFPPQARLRASTTR